MEVGSLDVKLSEPLGHESTSVADVVAKLETVVHANQELEHYHQREAARWLEAIMSRSWTRPSPVSSSPI